jgi:hypothetical protein
MTLPDWFALITCAMFIPLTAAMFFDLGYKSRAREEVHLDRLHKLNSQESPTHENRNH